MLINLQSAVSSIEDYNHFFERESLEQSDLCCTKRSIQFTTDKLKRPVMATFKGFGMIFPGKSFYNFLW